MTSSGGVRRRSRGRASSSIPGRQSCRSGGTGDCPPLRQALSGHRSYKFAQTCFIADFNSRFCEDVIHGAF